MGKFGKVFAWLVLLIGACGIIIDSAVRADFLIQQFQNQGWLVDWALWLLRAPPPWAFWLLLAVGGAFLLFVLKYKPALTSSPMPTEVTPIATAAKGATFDWNLIDAINHIQIAKALPDGRKDEVLPEIRQAARSGEIVVWGRPNSVGQSPGQFYKPIERIPTEHWKDYGIGALRCLFDSDTRQCGTEPDNGRTHAKGDAYMDLRVGRSEIESRWPIVIRVETPPDLDDWRDINHFSLWQAACLWVGVRPDLLTARRFDGEAYAAYTMLLRAYEHEGMTLVKHLPHEMEYSQVSRDQLVKLAYQKGRRPKFLFPE